MTSRPDKQGGLCYKPCPSGYTGVSLTLYLRTVKKTFLPSFHSKGSILLQLGMVKARGEKSWVKAVVTWRQDRVSKMVAAVLLKLLFRSSEVSLFWMGLVVSVLFLIIGNLKWQCHVNWWFLAAILWGRNNGGYKARPRKTIMDCSWKTTFTRLSVGGEVVRAADRAVMVWCPRHLLEQSPFFGRAKNNWISWHWTPWFEFLIIFYFLHHGIEETLRGIFCENFIKKSKEK